MKAAVWDCRQFVAGALAKSGHCGIDACADAGGPACSNGLDARVEAYAFGTVDGVISEE